MALVTTNKKGSLLCTDCLCPPGATGRVYRR